MHVSGKEALELAAYKLKGVAILWYEAWKQSRETNASAMWKEFKKAILYHFCHWKSESTVWISS